MTWDNMNYWLVSAFTGLLATVAFFARKIFTNEKEISLLRQALETADEYRKERDERVDDALSEIRSDIKQLIRRE